MNNLPEITKEHFDLLYTMRDEYLATSQDDKAQIVKDISKHLAYQYGKQIAQDMIEKSKNKT